MVNIFQATRISLYKKKVFVAPKLFQIRFNWMAWFLLEKFYVILQEISLYIKTYYKDLEEVIFTGQS